MTDDASKTDNVLPFSLGHRPPANALKPKPYCSGRLCTHQNVLVEESTREVTCARCDVVLDAFAVLLQYASQERRFDWASEAAQQELKVRQDRIEQLAAEEKRLKSRIRSVRKRDPDEAAAAQLASLESRRERTVANANDAMELLRKIIRANGGTTSEERTWQNAARAKRAPPTRIFGGDD